MVGYITYNSIAIRLRSAGFDVPTGTDKTFVRFDGPDALADAKAFIDGGRQVTDQVVYDMATQTPITN
jgi:hypothetical protein